jgi:hypothetical protein
MRTAITEARRKLLPGIIQQQYLQAKAAYDRQEFPAAVTGFKQVLDGLADPDVAAAASQAPLSDLKTLTTGFYDLSVKATAPPPPAPVIVLPPAPAAPAPPVRDFLRVYTAADGDVRVPTPVKQAFPSFPGKVPETMTGFVDLLIDATGVVQDATLRAPIHPLYDRPLLAAAKRWQYRPATLDGVPVKFMKTVQVNLTSSR